MASTSATVFTTQPILGVDLDSKSSTPAFAALTPVWANDGKKHVYVKALGTLASTATITIGDAGTVAAASAGAYTYTVNTTGGVVANQYFWAREKTV